MDLFARATNLLEQIEAFDTKTPQEVEQFRIDYIGSKGLVKDLLGELKNVPTERKREFGQLANSVKQAAEAKYALLKDAVATTETVAELPDLTRPANLNTLGARHPIAQIRRQIERIFERMGFVIAEGPEIEDDWHNFTALNTPPDHPLARYAGYFLYQHEPCCGVALPNLYGAGARYGTAKTAYPHYFARQGVSQRNYIGACAVPVSPNRRFIYCRKCIVCRLKAVPLAFCTRIVWQRYPNTLAPFLFPLYRAVGRGGRIVFYLQC